jgi:hypothetical protein
MTITARKYEDKIHALTGAYLLEGQKADLEPLLSALGCRYSIVRSSVSSVCEPEQPLETDEPLVQKTLLEALHWYCNVQGYALDGMSLLDGLLRRGRWKACLESTDDASRLAALLIEFLGALYAGANYTYADELRNRLLPDVCAMLNDWLRPEVEFRSTPTAALLLRHLFGDAWCALHLTGADDYWKVKMLVLVEQPPFLPGLLPAHLAVNAEELPELEPQ